MVNGDAAVAKVPGGQSINFAKLKRKAAFSWYSPGCSFCDRALGQSVTTSKPIAAILSNGTVARAPGRPVGRSVPAAASWPSLSLLGIRLPHDFERHRTAHLSDLDGSRSSDAAL